MIQTHIGDSNAHREWKSNFKKGGIFSLLFFFSCENTYLSLDSFTAWTNSHPQLLVPHTTFNIKITAGWAVYFWVILRHVCIYWVQNWVQDSVFSLCASRDSWDQAALGDTLPLFLQVAPKIHTIVWLLKKKKHVCDSLRHIACYSVSRAEITNCVLHTFL